jgi:hypothetical protein
MNRFKHDEFCLYFIVRSIVVGLLGAAIFSVIICILNTSRLVYVLMICVADFFIVLFVTRVFDRQMKHLVAEILGRLDKWPRAKGFLLKNL